MLKLSKKVEYALMALLHMEGRRAAELATAREIADSCGAPVELLGKVLQALARGGLIESEQGARGGYRLARPADRITLGEVIEVVDGPVHIAACQDDPSRCGQYPTCNIRQPVVRVQRELQDYMYKLSLAAFRREPAGAATR
ncbi:MAG TPA: Rrf2 family transcriptional regulator [Kiritimatiellia bacterium]|nr:Rrf2 family transcriptional regulator [Kiritimatiellia bacterium]HRZ12206.1 Rrf2 family transcriptional regulator [Kiritimatiellia bacterium]HSA18036.1 Rrf2 family transcriptional regulator [Kiritimatiellia bacterium]